MDLEDPLVFCLLLFFLAILPLPERLLARLKCPVALRYLLSGVVGLAAYAPPYIREHHLDDSETWILLGMLLLSPLWFSIGTRRSPTDADRGATVLRWLNIVGLAVSVLLVVEVLFDLLLWRPYGGFLVVITPAVVLLLIAWEVFRRRRTRFRWGQWLPGFPAILLVPVVVAVWAAFCSIRWYGPDYEGTWECYGWGFPLHFYGYWWRPRYSGFRFAPFLFDLAVVLAAGWIFSLAADRLVLRWVRRRRGRHREGHELEPPQA
jgi:hypothetical protein